MCLYCCCQPIRRRDKAMKVSSSSRFVVAPNSASNCSWIRMRATISTPISLFLMLSHDLQQHSWAQARRRSQKYKLHPTYVKFSEVHVWCLTCLQVTKNFCFFAQQKIAEIAGVLEAILQKLLAIPQRVTAASRPRFAGSTCAMECAVARNTYDFIKFTFISLMHYVLASCTAHPGRSEKSCHRGSEYALIDVSIGAQRMLTEERLYAD